MSLLAARRLTGLPVRGGGRSKKGGGMAWEDRRGEQRFLCSELVAVRWVSEFGSEREVVVNLEEVRPSGATLQSPGPIRPHTPLNIRTPKLELSGVVQTCRADFTGYLVEVNFDEGVRWSRELYEPEHLFDPRSLLPKDRLRLKNHELLAECCRALDTLGEGAQMTVHSP